MDMHPQIIEAFKEILNAGENLKQHLFKLSNYSISIYDPTSKEFRTDINQCITAFLDFYPSDMETPQHTTSYQGALGGNEVTLKLAAELNNKKDFFKQIVKRFMIEKNQRETTFIHKLLKEAQFPAIKLKQVYRHIPIIEFHPRLISYSSVKHNSKKRISNAEAQKKLLRAGRGEHIDVQLNKLNQSSSDLVIHRETAAVNLVNISSFKGDHNRVSTHRIFTSLPVIFLKNSDLPTPEVRFSHTRKNRKSRIDKNIEESVFLKSIHAYRYK